MSLLKVLQNIFFNSDTSGKITFYKLYQSLRKWQDGRIYPYPYELPNKISLPADFWKQVVRLYKQTLADEFERAISVFWADGDLIFSSVTRGNRKSVTPSNNIRVAYKRSKHEGYYTKEVFVDNKMVVERDIYKSRVPKKIEVKYLFNMHTHPPHHQNNATYYSFFSVQDIKSLLSSKAVITGMIGDKLWILFRTHQTPASIPDLQQSEVTIDTLIDKYGIITYSGDFNDNLVRHKSKIELAQEST